MTIQFGNLEGRLDHIEDEFDFIATCVVSDEKDMT